LIGHGEKEKSSDKLFYSLPTMMVIKAMNDAKSKIMILLGLVLEKGLLSQY